MIGCFLHLFVVQRVIFYLQNLCQNCKRLTLSLQTKQNSGIMVAVNPSLAHQR